MTDTVLMTSAVVKFVHHFATKWMSLILLLLGPDTAPMVNIQIVKSPQIRPSEWPKYSEWPVSSSIVAHMMNDSIIVWGGYQWTQEGALYLPTDAIFVFNIYWKSWQRIKASGNIPRRSVHYASVRMDTCIFMFGNLDEEDVFFFDIKVREATAACSFYEGLIKSASISNGDINMSINIFSFRVLTKKY